MEKILNNSERLRRAEEIYAKRRGIELEEMETQNSKIYKVLFKILLFVNIIIAVLSVQNKDSIFKEEFINQIFYYSNIINENINGFINNLKEKDDVKNNDTNEEKVNNTAGDSTNGEQNVENASILESSIENNYETENSEDLTVEQTIKKNYSFIKPIDGVITSGFGARESKYQNVTGYHKGIDIGAPKGTIINASMEGMVTQVSSLGDYRKTFEN